MRRTVIVAILCGTLLLAPAALAAEGEFYVTPKTDVARSIEQLFNITLVLALIVFVFVEGLLFYILWRFRHNKTVPSGEQHRGHTGAEIAWTIVPAVILLGLGTVSAMTLFTVDEIPQGPDVLPIRVEASQFVWRFTYPDGTSSINEIRVEEGRTVRLDIVAKDVIHAFFVPEFALKVDAVPGRTNQQWFIAPAPGEYHFECAEYCGFGHHEMGAANPSTKIVVFAKGAQEQPFGKPPKAPTTPTPNASS